VAHTVAVILYGGFVKKKLKDSLRKFPAPDDIVGLVAETMKKPRLADAQLFRVYYYDAVPFEGRTKNPVDGSPLDFSTTPQARLNRQLIDTLEMKPDFAVRRGEIIHTGWKLGHAALRSLSKNPRAVTAQDFVPDMGQKGVDIKIGLDIARIAVKRIVDIIVLARIIHERNDACGERGPRRGPGDGSSDHRRLRTGHPFSRSHSVAAVSLSRGAGRAQRTHPPAPAAAPARRR
jgi:hypothetical protein